MINCTTKDESHRFICRSFFLWLSVLVLILISSAPAFCYELSGTATGNILSGGFTAKNDAFSASASVDTGYALVITKDGKTFTADRDNAQYLNLRGDKVYYTTIDGYANETKLRCYDVSSGNTTDLYTVPIAKGIKNLFVVGDQAYFQTDGTVKAYDLETGAVTAVKGSGEIAAFVPVSNVLLYSAYEDGATALYAYDTAARTTTALAKNVTTFDAHGADAYYSNGDGLYRVALSGGSPKQLATGTVNQIVCDGNAVYWQGSADDTVTSLSYGDADKDTQKVDDYTSFAVLDGGVETVKEDIGEGGSGSATTSDISLSSLPSGTYKSWKQGDSRWSGVAMGSSTVGSIGCLVTSVSILLVGSGAEKTRYQAGTFNPGVFATELSNNGGLTGGGGLVWGKVNVVEPSFNYATDTTVSSWSSSDIAAKVSDYLAAGRYVTICVDNPSTGNTHWVAADYVTGSTVYECDPGYTSKSSLLFDNYPSVTRLVSFTYSGTAWGGEYGTVSTPTITLSGKTVSMSCATSGATIYYTTDGSTPTTSSTKYSAPFALTYSKAVKAIAVCDNYNNSAVASKDCVLCSLPFSDVLGSDWYYLTVAQVYERGVFGGTSTTTFNPTTNMIRADFVTVIARISGRDVNEYYYGGFGDVDQNAYYAASVNWAASEGIVSGVDGNLFAPNDKITREQACVIIVRFANVIGINLSASQAAVTFSDNTSISSYAKDAVTTAQKAGLINGKGDNQFDPQGYATRAEVAAIMLRLLNKI